MVKPEPSLSHRAGPHSCVLNSSLPKTRSTVSNELASGTSDAGRFIEIDSSRQGTHSIDRGSMRDRLEKKDGDEFIAHSIIWDSEAIFFSVFCQLTVPILSSLNEVVEDDHGMAARIGL